jgi:hypothetical protein
MSTNAARGSDSDKGRRVGVWPRPRYVRVAAVCETARVAAASARMRALVGAACAGEQPPCSPVVACSGAAYARANASCSRIPLLPCGFAGCVLLFKKHPSERSPWEPR